MHRHIDDKLRDDLSAAIDAERVAEVESILEFALWGLLFEDLRLASRALTALAPHDGVWAVRVAAARVVLRSHQGSDLLGVPELAPGAPTEHDAARVESTLVALSASRCRAQPEVHAEFLVEMTRRDIDGTLEAPGSPPLLRALLRVQLAIAHLHAGSSAAALAHFAIAARLSDSCATLHRSILAKSATVHALRGNLVEARRQLRRFDRVGGEIPATWTRALREEQALAEALILVERFDAHDPDREWPEVEASDDLWPVTALLRARQALLERSPMRALEIVEFAEATHPGGRSLLAQDVVASMKAHALLQLAEPDRAREVLDEAPEGPLVVLAMAHLHMFTGQAATARELAAGVLARPTSSLVERAEALLLRVWADAVLGRAPTPGDGGIIGRMVVAAGLVRIIAHMPGWLMDEIVDLSERGMRTAFEAAVEKASAALVVTERPRLTPREAVVLKALECYGSVSDMAKALSVSQSTVKTQLSAIYRKLGVTSRHHAVPAAYRLGLLDRSDRVQMA